MSGILRFRIITTDWPVEAALALAHGSGFLPGVDVLVLPAGLDVERVNALLGGTPPGEGAPVTALRDDLSLGVAAGDLGMVQTDEEGRGLAVLLGQHVAPFDARLFAPAWAMTYLALQRHAARFRHVVAASGPSTDLRYAAVAARAATAEVTVLGTPDQIFRMVGPRDGAGVPASPEFRTAVGGGGHRVVRIVGGGGVTIAELPLRRWGR